MLTVDDYGGIRRAHRDGMSIRGIARDFGHSRRKIRQVLSESQPAPYTRTRPPQASVLGPFHSIIDQILESDEWAPPKQRHTAMQVFRRLRDESCASGEPLLAAHATIAAWPKGGEPWPRLYTADRAASRTGGKSSPAGSEVIRPSGRSAGLP